MLVLFIINSILLLEPITIHIRIITRIDIEKKVYLLLAGALTYAGILFGTPHYHYYTFKSDIKELTDLRNLNMQEMRAEIQESINYYEIPVKMSSVAIERLSKYYWIRVSWQETVNFMDLYEKNVTVILTAVQEQPYDKLKSRRNNYCFAVLLY